MLVCMEYFTLNGAQVSRIGLGTWAIGGSEWGAVSEVDAIATCLAIFDHGINLIDTAPIYGFGRSEELIGKAMRQHGRREDFYIATKAGLEWNDRGVFSNSDPARLRQEFEDSLRRLGTDYADLYQIHWPDTTLPVERAAEVLRELYDAGRIRAVGVSNFSINHVRKALEVSPLPIVTNQVEFHPLLNQRELLEYCHSRGVIITAYSPLGRGELLRDARITKIADKYGKTPAQVLLRWALQKGMIVIPKASSEPHLRDNLGALGWELDEEDMATIEAMNENKRIIDPDFAEWNLPYEQIA